MSKHISCIVCAYNEAPRIAHVVEAVLAHPLVDEVIVVDDGSTDGTAEVASACRGTRVIILEKNHGKSFALAQGLKHSTHELVMLLDADLRGLTDEAITALAAPVSNGAADVSISLRKNSLRTYKAIGLDFVSGERVFSKALVMPYLESIQSLPGFGFEAFLNRLIIDQGLKVAVVRWQTIEHARKAEKAGVLKGVFQEAWMLFEVLKVISLYEILRQHWHLLRLSRPRSN